MGTLAAMWAETAKVFEDFRVEDWGADFVHAGCPLAEIDLAAAVTAEGEVLVVEADQFAAGGAAEELGGFFLGWHGGSLYCTAICDYSTASIDSIGGIA
jgi:hypothetical protein